MVIYQGSALCEIPNDGKGRKVKGEQMLYKKLNFFFKSEDAFKKCLERLGVRPFMILL